MKRTLICFAVAAIAASYAVFLLERNTVFRLGREDGLFEDVTAVCFFAASALFAMSFWRSRGAGNDLAGFRTRRNLFFLLLAMLFFVGGGEEISWGQRIFGWETPDSFQKSNLQRETNLHNLKLFHRQDVTGQGKSGLSEFVTAERLFSLFWFGFCVAVPLGHRFIGPLARLLRRVNVPIVPLGLGLLFMVNYAMGEALKPHALHLDLDWPLMEIKECLFSVLFVLIGVYFLRGLRAAAAETPAVQAVTPQPPRAAPTSPA